MKRGRTEHGFVGPVIAFLAMAAAPAVQAQGVSLSMGLAARVLSPLTVTGQRDLDFGAVTAGVAKTIATTAATSGRFRINGQAGAPVIMNLTLPSDLVQGGSNLLPIGSWTGRHNTNAGGGGTAFNPTTANVPATLAGGSGNLFVFLGATVSPAVGQPGGSYSATITLTVIY